MFKSGHWKVNEKEGEKADCECQKPLKLVTIILIINTEVKS
jgi:hypothetical protein